MAKVQLRYKPECCYAVDDFAADVDAFMDAVGIEEATLVDHSSDAIIAQRVALSYPRRVSRLVLIGSPMTLLNNEAVMGLRKEMLALGDPLPPELVREFQESVIDHSVPEEFLSTVVSESLQVPGRVWRDCWEGAVLTVDHVARLGEIEEPTSFLRGSRTPSSRANNKSGQRRSAMLRSRVYPDTSHAVHWERPEQVVRDLEEFMRGGRPA
jgi:non-heme chloroperoxidase